jgi:hypothetical protein
MLRARTQREYRQNLRARIDGQPEHLGGVAQSGSKFVQLQVREVQIAEGVLMEELSVLACPREPPRNRGMSKAEDPLCSRKIQSFGKPQRGPEPLDGKEFSGDTTACSAWK